MISVEEAIARIGAAVVPLESETVALELAYHRVVAQDVLAIIDQPPAPIAAMDGYAVRLADASKQGVTLRVIGTAPAGHPYSGTVGAGEAVRIFTGGVVPKGADSIVIQENVDTKGDSIQLRAPAAAKHIRGMALDFRRGDVLVEAGRRLSARDLALIAAGNLANVAVRRKPLIAFVATGDELSHPGEPPRSGGVVASSGYALRAVIDAWGGETLNLGILPDRIDALQQIPEKAARADAIVTMGGASVGDHDLIQHALTPMGFSLDFWKIAMRPGKPLIFGRLGAKPFLGLPGNPVSSYVCAVLFLQPLIASLLGMRFRQQFDTARIAHALKANDFRQDYIRARLCRRAGDLWAEPFPIQDLSMQGALARADALIVRSPHSSDAAEGDKVAILSLTD